MCLLIFLNKKNDSTYILLGDILIKYKVYVLLFFILMVLSLGFIDAKSKEYPLLGKVIYIDPGHGGRDPGAVYRDIREDDINLQISLKLRDTLEQQGAIVYLTRDGDYDLSVPNTINRKRSDLSRRSNIIDNSMCDIFLSIHLNAESSGTWYGAQVFYDNQNPKTKVLAEIMQKELVSNLRTKRKAKETSDLYFHKRIERPGILIEAGFLSNANERYLLRQEWYQQKLATVITNGVIKYFQQ